MATMTETKDTTVTATDIRHAKKDMADDLAQILPRNSDARRAVDAVVDEIVRHAYSWSGKPQRESRDEAYFALLDFAADPASEEIVWAVYEESLNQPIRWPSETRNRKLRLATRRLRRAAEKKGTGE